MADIKFRVSGLKLSGFVKSLIGVSIETTRQRLPSRIGSAFIADKKQNNVKNNKNLTDILFLELSKSN